MVAEPPEELCGVLLEKFNSALPLLRGISTQNRRCNFGLECDQSVRNVIDAGAIACLLWKDSNRQVNERGSKVGTTGASLAQ
jgi:hypothetical protein